MATVVRRNERSWAIDLISKINLIAKNNDLVIKKAGGENTISTGRGNTMFPDVVLYGNVEQSVIPFPIKRLCWRSSPHGRALRTLSISRMMVLAALALIVPDFWQ